MTKASTHEILQELGLPLVFLESLQSCVESRAEHDEGVLGLQALMEGCVLTVVKLVGIC